MTPPIEHISRNESPEQTREIMTQSQIIGIVRSYISNSDIVEGIMDTIEANNNKIYHISEPQGRYLFIDGETSHIINVSPSLNQGENWIYEGADKLSLESRIEQDVAGYEEKLLHIDILQNSIMQCLERNNTERMGSIGAEDIITSGPLAGIGIIEASLILRKNIEDLGNYHAQVRLNETRPNITDSFDRFYNQQEYYLHISMGIGDKHESLGTHIPKNFEETQGLLNLVISRRSVPEIFEYMRNVHALMDDNEYQSQSVQNIYAAFTDQLNAIVLSRLETEVLGDSSNWNFTPGEYHGDSSILYEFANIVSGRTRGYEPNMFFHDGVLGSEDQSRVSEDLWRPQIALEAIAISMRVPLKNHEDEQQNTLMDQISSHIHIQDPYLNGKNPSTIVNDAENFIKHTIIDTDKEGNAITLGEIPGFDLKLAEFGLLKIITKNDNNNLADSYNELNFEEMTQISVLARILYKKDNKGPGRTVRYSNRQSGITLMELNELISSASIATEKHIGSQIDKAIDDTWGEVWTDTVLHTSEEWQNKRRASEFGITEQNSMKYQIFTLYNDLQGNGGFLDVSDTRRSQIKTGGEILVSIGGAMVLGGAIIASINLARNIYLASKATQIGLQAQGVLYGLSGSTTGYMLDYIEGDAIGFGSSSEALLGLSTDFGIGALTGGIGGMIAAKYGNPEALFFSRGNIRNQAIFAGDLTTLGLAPEFARMALLEKVYHNKGVYLGNKENGTIQTQMISIQKSLFSYELNSEQTTEYFNENPNWDILPRGFQNYRVIHQMFPMMGLESIDIPRELDMRFLKAYSYWKIIHPWEVGNLWQVEDSFQNIMQLGEGGIEEFHSNLITTIESWVEKYEEKYQKVL